MVKTVPRGVIEHWFVMVSPLCFWPLQSRSPCCTVASNCSTSGSQGLQLEDLTQRVKGQTHLLGSPKARILSIAISHPCLIPLFVVVSGPWVRFRFPSLSLLLFVVVFCCLLSLSHPVVRCSFKSFPVPVTPYRSLSSAVVCRPCCVWLFVVPSPSHPIVRC